MEQGWRPARDGGFTLVEVLVSLVILTTGLVAVAQLLSVSTRVNLGARAETFATALAAGKMEELVADGGGAVSPPGTLAHDTPGFVDYVDVWGRVLDPGPASAGWVCARRWAVEPLAGSPDTLVVVRVVGTRAATGRCLRAAAACRRAADDARAPGVAVMARRTAAERGHTLLELLVAASLLLVVLGALISILAPAHSAFRTQPETADLQQRLRLAVNALYTELAGSGAGFTVGGSPGPLVMDVPAILPYRLATRGTAPASGAFYQPDAITVLTISSSAVQCLALDRPASASAPIPLDRQPSCPAGDPACGFESGMRVLVAGTGGAWDLLTVTGVQEAAFLLDHDSDELSALHGAGSRLGAVEAHSYFLRTEASTGTPQLVRFDGASQFVVLDHVVDLRFRYFGAVEPPALVRAVSDPLGPSTTYGPAPPALDQDSGGGNWPPGENCVFRVEDDHHVPRLDRLAADAGTEALLAPGMLVDGPWCPGPSSPGRFDADLLRVSRVRVTIRVQVAAEVLRGPSGVLFSRAGSSTGAQAFVPDLEITIDVAPRNLRRR